jgi:CheY-like chemotaxis protein
MTLPLHQERTPTVLIADGDRVTRAALWRCLLLDGYEVLMAGDGRELAQLIDDGASRQPPVPDLILTDMRLPLRDGFEVIGMLRERDRHTPVVFLTRTRSTDVVANAKALAASAVIDKPFDDEELRSVVALSLARRAPHV